MPTADAPCRPHKRTTRRVGVHARVGQRQRCHVANHRLDPVVRSNLLLWKQSILWIAFMSLDANVAGDWSAYQAARGERREEEGEDESGS